MNCKNPLEKCCEITPSGCVQWTGNLSTGSRTIADCEISLNSIIEQMDSNLTLVLNHIEIKVSELKDADTCKKIYDHIDDLKVKSTDGFVYSNKIILELVKIVCDLQSQISIIYENTKLKDSFFNLELPDSLKADFACLTCDEGCNELGPNTFGNLLHLLVGKIIDYEKKHEKLGCAYCACTDC